MYYPATMDEIGALSRHFTGWTRADLMGMSVRERRHWVEWMSAIRNRQKREAEQQAALNRQQTTVLGR